MSSTSAALILGLASALTAACRTVNPAFCDSHPDDRDCRTDAAPGMARDAGPGAVPDAVIDAVLDAGGCTADLQCAGATAVCDAARGRCVACTAAEPGACRDGAPVCGDGDVCRGCLGDAECASRTCLPDGACAAPGSVLYAAAPPAGSATAPCTPAAPCTLPRAVALVDATRSTVRLDPGRYDLADALVLAVDLRIVGRDATIDRDAGGTGATLQIADGATVALDYVAIEGGDGEATGSGIACTAATVIGREITVEGNAAAGINSIGCDLALHHAWIAANQGPGIAASGGSLAVVRSQLIGNQAGGLAITAAPFVVQNNVIVKNGNPTSGFGGVSIAQIAARGMHAFDFNTVAQNQAADGSTPGVICSIVTTPLVFSSNIVFGNAAGAQVEGSSCAWTYSDVGPVPVAGTGNLTSDPAFLAPAQNNFHLQVSSPLRDAADPAATLADDLDGDPRPQGRGRDVGADEIK